MSGPFDGALPERVSVREVGLRDGLQIEAPVPTEAKLRLLEAVVATGVPRVELTSFVSARAVPALADAERVAAAALERFDDVLFSALVASRTGVDRALAAGLTDVEYVVSASDTHSRANVGRGTEESVALTAELAETVHAAGGRLEAVIAIAWDCPFEGPTPPERVLGIAEAVVAAGADALCLADTIGTTTPLRLVELVRATREHAPGLDVGIHLHDTRGMGAANALAAVTAGVTSLDASVGGLGGCPFAPGASGNVATEELVYLLDGIGVATGLDLRAVLHAAGVARDAVGHELTSSLLKADGGAA
ncbi:hydroxymethylglutaryl-CoA lyase [Nocardioides anomalus]|uniref:hydroxymethylglutaryl-CoA lyase n=1 Tax=Nocardioides anomalus TaxID=2712223 RepID=UPI001E315431|nr:hydroxymethylglutaryl-CoA lyase [Nocardioides anomalus]